MISCLLLRKMRIFRPNATIVWDKVILVGLTLSSLVPIFLDVMCSRSTAVESVVPDPTYETSQFKFLGQDFLRPE